MEEKNTPISSTKGVGMVYMNRTTTAGVGNLPPATSWRRREISVRNIGTQGIIVKGVATGDKSSIVPAECVTYKSDGTTWWTKSINV